MLVVKNIQRLCAKLGMGIGQILRDFNIHRDCFYTIGVEHKPTAKTMRKVFAIEKYLQEIERLFEDEINVPLLST